MLTLTSSRTRQSVTVENGAQSRVSWASFVKDRTWRCHFNGDFNCTLWFQHVPYTVDSMRSLRDFYPFYLTNIKKWRYSRTRGSLLEKLRFLVTSCYFYTSIRLLFQHNLRADSWRPNKMKIKNKTLRFRFCLFSYWQFKIGQNIACTPANLLTRAKGGQPKQRGAQRSSFERYMSSSLARTSCREDYGIQRRKQPSATFCKRNGRLNVKPAYSWKTIRTCASFC